MLQVSWATGTAVIRGMRGNESKKTRRLGMLEIELGTDAACLYVRQDVVAPLLVSFEREGHAGYMMIHTSEAHFANEQKEDKE